MPHQMNYPNTNQQKTSCVVTVENSQLRYADLLEASKALRHPFFSQILVEVRAMPKTQALFRLAAAHQNATNPELLDSIKAVQEYLYG